MIYYYVPWFIALFLTTLHPVSSNTDVEHLYKTLKPGQNFTGTILDEKTTTSEIECGGR